MPVQLDVITRKKLILIRRLYQRAILQAEARHSQIDRILSLITFDLSNETMLKTIVTALDSSRTPASDFQSILQQAESVLASARLPAVPDKAKIQNIRALRNDAQHKARYPNDIEISDCRTYTRDFLGQVAADVWGQSFESLSLVDVVQNKKAKSYLAEAERETEKGDYTQAVIKSIAGFSWAVHRVKASIVGELPRSLRAVVGVETFNRTVESAEILETLRRIQDVVMRFIIGLSFSGHRRYMQITRATAVILFMESGDYQAQLVGHVPDQQEAEYVLDFATNAVIQIEDLVGDIEKPFAI